MSSLGSHDGGGESSKTFPDSSSPADFESCLAEYANMSPKRLTFEAKTIFESDMLSTSWDLVAARLEALLISLITCAANYSEMTPRRRSRMVELAIHVDRFLASRAAASQTDHQTAGAPALGATLAGVRLFGLFPIVADLVENHVTDYTGPFEESAVVYE